MANQHEAQTLRLVDTDTNDASRLVAVTYPDEDPRSRIQIQVLFPPWFGDSSSQLTSWSTENNQNLRPGCTKVWIIKHKPNGWHIVDIRHQLYIITAPMSLYAYKHTSTFFCMRSTTDVILASMPFIHSYSTQGGVEMHSWNMFMYQNLCTMMYQVHVCIPTRRIPQRSPSQDSNLKQLTCSIKVELPSGVRILCMCRTVVPLYYMLCCML